MCVPINTLQWVVTSTSYLVFPQHKFSGGWKYSHPKKMVSSTKNEAGHLSKFTSGSWRVMAFPSESCLKISIEKATIVSQLAYLSVCLWLSCPGPPSQLNVLTAHTFQAKEQADKALQCHDSRGGAIAHSKQVQRLITNPPPWKGKQRLVFS